MRIDLHLHTSPRSSCSVMAASDAVSEAAALGLDGVCITDHHALVPRAELDRLSAAAGILVLGATEVTTEEGDVLVFGLRRAVDHMVTLAELRERALEDGAFMVAAHPFRGFLLFGPGHLGMSPEKAVSRRLFAHVDAVEVCNGRLTPAENGSARQVAERLGLPGTGGSDAHRLDEIGHCVTVFADPITCERDLVAALRAGACSAERFTPP